MALRGIIEGQQPAAGARRRGGLRVRLNLEVANTVGDSEQPDTVVLHNLSATGMLIETPFHIEVGQQLTVELPIAGVVSASAVWTSEALVGCRFARPVSRAVLSAAQLQNPLPKELDPAGRSKAEEHPRAARLRRLRAERGLTRKELAAKAGVSAPSLWAWETGKTEPRRSSLSSLATALCVPIEVLEGTDVEANIPSNWSVGAAGELASKSPQGGVHESSHLLTELRDRIASTLGVPADKVKIIVELH